MRLSPCKLLSGSSSSSEAGGESYGTGSHQTSGTICGVHLSQSSQARKRNRDEESPHHGYHKRENPQQPAAIDRLICRRD
jgi:hypothetical protein